MRLIEGHADIDDVDAFVAELDAIADAHDCAVTALDARSVAGREHLAVAVDRANRAVAREDAIADDRGIEILLYAAGRRQIDRALEMGVEAGRNPVVVVVDAAGGPGEPAAAEAVEGLLEPADTLGTAREDDRICEFFGISPTERGATDARLEWLVIERVSLLAIDK